MSDHQPAHSIPQLAELAEFRYRLRRFLSFSEAASERLGIQAQQYQLLQVIGATPPEQAASITWLAERMALRHNSTVELVDRAERAGLVTRQSDQRDLRRSLVQLTAHGEELLRTLVRDHLAELRARGEELVGALHIVMMGEEPAEMLTVGDAATPPDA